MNSRVNEKKEIEILREIYVKAGSLISKVEHESPCLSNLGIGYSFHTKLACLEIMQRCTLEKMPVLFKTSEEEKEKSVYLKDTTSLLYEGIAFFEAYLNALYSFLQIIAKVTPYFYEKSMQEQISDFSFGSQVASFRKNPVIDPEYSTYLMNNMEWYDEFTRNRNAVTHNVAAFLGFGKEQMVFIHMPRKRIDFFENGKPTKELKAYILGNWALLFSFLNFYVTHFSARKIYVDKEQELKEINKIIHRSASSQQ